MAFRWIIGLSVVLALPATAARAADGAPGEAAAAAEHGQPAQQRRPTDRMKPGQGGCIGCTPNGAARRPLIEAPNRALMLIPASWSGDAVAGRRYGSATPPPRMRSFVR